MWLFNKPWRPRLKPKTSPFKSCCWLALFAATCVLLSYMGVFTHLYEKDYYSEFSYPLNVDLQRLVNQHFRGDVPETEPINVFNYTYIKASVNTCEDSTLSPRLLFVVKSAMSHFEQRQAIRETWGNPKRFSDVVIRRVFLLGTGSDRDLQRRVDLEDDVYGDIVQADFHDNYRNNTLKTMSGFKWAVEKCSLAEFVLFSDDDMYISTKNVLRFLRNPSNYPEKSSQPVRGSEHRERSLKQDILIVSDDDTARRFASVRPKEESKLYAGYVFHSPPLRHKWSKWFVPLEEYPYHLWPPYVTAGAYVVSREALLSLHYGSFYTKYFQFDDIFVGLVALKVNIEPFHCEEFYFWKKSYSKSGYRDVIASHGYGNPDELRRVWHEQKSAGHA